MASAGQNFNQTVMVASSPEEVSQAVFASSAGVVGYTVTTAGSGTILLTRKYLPTWAIVVAILGVFLFLIGLLALLARNTETVSVTFAPAEGGTRVAVSGVGSKELLARLTATISSLPSIA